MKGEFAALSSIPLKPGTTYDCPPELPELVHLDSPALEVMTDLRVVRAVTTRPEVPIDEALEHMKRSGVRLLLATSDSAEIVGIVTAKDIQGEKPIKIVEESRVPRSAIRVSMVMTPQHEIQALNMLSVRNARVGHIVETLRQLERQHALVVEVDDTTKAQRLRGIFSTSQIARQLGHELGEELAPAHSLAEIQHGID